MGFNPYPHWHPSYERARDSLEVHPVCADCNEDLEIDYALEITPMVQDILEASRNLHKALSSRLSVAMEAWNRKDHGEALEASLAARYQLLHGADPRTQPVPALWEKAQGAKRAAAKCSRETTQAIAERLADFDFPGLFERLMADSAQSCYTA